MLKKYIKKACLLILMTFFICTTDALGQNYTVWEEMERIFFEETWDSASFTYQNWTTDSNYWQINTEFGNPFPCAEFTSDSIISDYEYRLITQDYCGCGTGPRYASKVSLDVKLQGSILI